MATSENQPEDRSGVEIGRRDPASPWFGFERFDGLAAPARGTPEDQAAVTIQAVPAGRWTTHHVDRLLGTAPARERDTSGLVPVVAVQATDDGGYEVVALRTDAPRFQERLDFRTPPTWNEGAGVTLAAALAMEKGHSLGLRHGALRPVDVVIDGADLAIAGMGLSVRGTPEPDLPMAPEVAAGGVPTVSGDVFSLGLLLAAATAGDPGTPPEILSLIEEATASDPAERPPSALAFADRLREAGGDAIRSYALMSFADSPLLPGTEVTTPPPVPAPPAAEPTAEPADQPGPGLARRAVPWVVGAGLVALIGLGLWAAADGDGAQPATTTTTEPTTTTTTDATTTTTTDATTTELTTTTTTDAPTTTTTDATTTTTEPTTTTTSVVTPIPLDEAGFEVLHAFPDTPVDAYLDGQLAIAGFQPGEIAGPVEIEPGSHTLDLYAAADDPPAAATDRNDDELISAGFDATEQPATLVVAPDADGNPAVQVFLEPVEPAIPAGQGRLALRNPGPGAIEVTIAPAAGGSPTSRTLDAGEVLVVDRPTGDLRITIADTDGSPLIDTIVSIPEGTLTSATVAVTDDGGQIYIQRIGGLGSPPDGIPTGDSGLLDPSSSTRQRGLLLAAVSSILLLVLVGQQRLQRNAR